MKVCLRRKRSSERSGFDAAGALVPRFVQEIKRNLMTSAGTVWDLNKSIACLPFTHTQYGRQVMMPGMSASLQQGGLTICHLPRFRPVGTRLCGFLHGPAQPAFEKLRSPGKRGTLAFAHAIRAGEGRRRRHDRRDREVRSRTEGARGGKDEVFDDEAARYQGRRGPPRRKDQKRKARKGCQQRFVWRWRERQRWPRREGQ